MYNFWSLKSRRKKTIASVIVSGNPWLLFPELQFKVGLIQQESLFCPLIAKKNHRKRCFGIPPPTPQDRSNSTFLPGRPPEELFQTAMSSVVRRSPQSTDPPPRFMQRKRDNLRWDIGKSAPKVHVSFSPALTASPSMCSLGKDESAQISSFPRQKKGRAGQRVPFCHFSPYCMGERSIIFPVCEVGRGTTEES